MANDNKMLGQFGLVGIPPAPKGVPQIEVTFDIDSNGIVKVSARDKATGKEQSLRIQTSGGLSEAEIQKMVRDAELNAENDRKRKAFSEAKNQAESIAYDTEKNLREHKDKIPANEVTELESAISNLKTFIAQTQDADALKNAAQELQQKSFKAFGNIYKQGEQPSQSDDAPQDQQQQKPDDAVDADYREVKK